MLLPEPQHSPPTASLAEGRWDRLKLTWATKSPGKLSVIVGMGASVANRFEGAGFDMGRLIAF